MMYKSGVISSWSGGIGGGGWCLGVDIDKGVFGDAGDGSGGIELGVSV